VPLRLRSEVWTIGGSIGYGEEPAPPDEDGSLIRRPLVGKPGFNHARWRHFARRTCGLSLTCAVWRGIMRSMFRATEALKAAEQALASASRGVSGAASYAELRRKQVAAANDTVLHELYFPKTSPWRRSICRDTSGLNMREHMGRFESWRGLYGLRDGRQEVGCMVYDPYDDRWHTRSWTVTSTCVDRRKSARCLRCKRARLLEGLRASRGLTWRKFLERIAWDEVASRYKSVDRM